MTVKADPPALLDVAAPPEALALLRRLTGPHGIQASGAQAVTAEYHAVFARDAIMAGIAGLLAGDDVVVEGLSRSLATLRRHLGAQGQVPSNVRMEASGATHVSFGSLAPRLDSCSWYLLGAALLVREGREPAAVHASTVRRVVALLDGLEYNGRHLLWVPTGGNWADEYVTEGHTLSDQALRAWALRACAEAFGEPSWQAKAAAIGDAIAAQFADESATRPAWPLAAVRPVERRRALDLAGCALLALSGVAPAMADDALDAIAARFLDAGRLPPAFSPVIREGDPDWPALRRYHLHAFRNAPHEYHNGGVWPIWLGWLGLALGARDRGEALGRLRRLTDAATVAPYDFHEFLHGETLAPLGNAAMAYSATGAVFLAVAGHGTQRRVLP